MKSKVFLIRHGETDENRHRIIQGQTAGRLSDLGRQQAVLIGRRLSKHPFAAVYSSDLSRAADTARIIAEELGLSSIQYDVRLRERAYGAYEGRPLFSLLRALSKANTNLKKYVPDNGETYDSVMHRTRDFLCDIGEEYPGAAVVAVTHHGVIEAALDIREKASNSGMLIQNCDGIVVQLSCNAIVHVEEFSCHEPL
jgi:probable phosphoglycerate mutase